MKLAKQLACFIIIGVSTNFAWGAQIHECEDEQGNRTFQKHCPPGSKSLSARNYKVKKNDTDKDKNLPSLVLYSIPECEVCDDMRKDLTSKNLSVTEKNIKDNGDLQQELKAKTGGDLRVPVLLIGEKVVAGYDADKLRAALQQAGHLPQEQSVVEE